MEKEIDREDTFGEASHFLTSHQTPFRRREEELEKAPNIIHHKLWLKKALLRFIKKKK